jgi:hypothetical protein
MKHTKKAALDNTARVIGKYYTLQLKNRKMKRKTINPQNMCIISYEFRSPVCRDILNSTINYCIKHIALM